MIRPCFSKLSSAVRTVLDGIAKPTPCDPPVVDAIAVLIPITSPRRLINGPAVARIYCGIGLQQLTKEIAAIRPSLRADDSLCHGFLKSKRITDSQDKISRLNSVRVSKFEWLDAGIIDFKHG